MSTGKQTIKLRIKPHRFNRNDDWKKIKKEVSKRFGYHINRDEINKIADTYFGSYLQDKLLNEGEFVFLSKVGKLNIFKEHISDNPRYLHALNIGAIAPQLHKRIGYIYSIVYTKGAGIAKEVKFLQSKKLKEKLNYTLNNTTKEYKPKPINNNN